ncbi:NCS2 family permease [Patescibacteria group bacterium]|nr:NCS2 family permease [Patescibacteria group bacterium]MBU1721315.1 NCS2 family permease [Patescibacteria group bacterium]MBU1901745.1 NCS2 family permease [Patescibacteria group bacterium]
MIQKIENYFDFKQLGSTWKIEILAGLSTFLSLSYIFVVNPTILSEAGINKSVVFFATVIVSSLATIIMGLWANKPFSLAPGLEMNAYVAFIVVGTLGFVWQDALGAVFWSGVVMLVINFLHIREQIIKAIPDKLKSGLAASVGVFLMLIALKVSGILAYEGIQIKGLGLLNSPEAYVFYIGLIITLVLRRFKVKGTILISIIIASVVAHLLGIGEIIEPVKVSKEMLSGTFAFNLSVIFNTKIISVILILFIIDFYGSIAKFIGLTRNTTMVDKKGNMPKMKEALTIDGGATIIGSMLGTTNVTTYVESAVGIGEGGRTGLTAVVSGILMLFFLLLTPLINLVPVVATTGALLFVGSTLLPTKKDLKTYHWTDIVVVGTMIPATIWTFGLDKAMLVGFGLFIILQITRGEWKKVNPYLLASTILLLLSISL